MASPENDREDSSPSAPRPLHLLNTEMLLADLISGRLIATNEGHSLVLATDAARSALNWYRINRPKWSGNVMVADCEAIVDAIASAPPVISAPAATTPHAVRHLRLIKVVAHRFAGLHAYGTDSAAPDDFVFEPDKPITLFEGWNGSGKTSLANAIIWCLTGDLLRPQRSPEAGDREFECVIGRNADPDSAHAISPVTPLPDAQAWSPIASAKTIPADTWVELYFVDADGSPCPPIRRTQSRKPNGKLTETAPDPATLGVDPVAFRLGTTMPGILPFLQIGSASELGLAIAKLTGLADLVQLARHATKAAERIGGSITKDLEKERDRIDGEFLVHRTDLDERINEFPAMRPSDQLPEANGEDAAAAVSRLTEHFEKLKARGLVDAADVLGDSFDPEIAEQRKDLEDQINPAIMELRKLSAVPSFARIGQLKLEASEISQVKATLAQLRSEATLLDDLAKDPTLAKRTQLYARVTNWAHEHGETDDDNCAVCRQSVLGVIDPQTGIAVTEHLRRVRDDGEVAAKSIAKWAADWSGALARDLPEALRGELNRDLPASPEALLRRGLTEDLFATEPFSGTLAALAPLATKLTDAALANLPIYVDPESVALPSFVATHASSLNSTLRRIERALSFIEWMAANPGALRAVVKVVLDGEPGSAQASVDTDQRVAHSASLNASLARLDFIVSGVAPISAALTLCERMQTSLGARKLALDRAAACAVCVEALKNIIPIGELAHAQVEGLRCQLHDRATYWRDQIYQSATTFAPRPQASGMNAQGVIEIHVGRGAVRAPAQHISNASALRAGLMAFYLAFREHVLSTSGGITTLVLDDPQDLLDYDNRQRLARAITQLSTAGGQVITTTHDRSFARTLVQEARSADLIAHRSVHPVNVSRSTLETSLAVEELDRKRQAFFDHPDSASAAQDYANEARIFIEARLGDLFDDPAYPAHSVLTKPPTLVPLFDRLKGLLSQRSNELFKSPILAAFCNDAAMSAGADARRVLNQSHHDKASISYADVERVDADLKRLRAGVERVHGEFRRYRWREPLVAETPTNVVTLIPLKAPLFNVPVSQDIAAFTGHLPSGGSQADDAERLTNTWFDDKALFYIRHDTMGFAVPAGMIAIVEAESTTVGDHSLVVARRGNQTYARRLLRPRNGEGFLLAAEATDPRRSRPTLAFEDHGIDVHRVVGVMFSQLPPPESREEATQIDEDPTIGQIEVGYRVCEESAVPLALPKQTILGGRLLSPADLPELEGRIVALTLMDGASILKRVGASVSSALPYLRQFETIGGLGDSVVIATEAVEGAPDVPVMAYARAILGVIYD